VKECPGWKEGARGDRVLVMLSVLVEGGAKDERSSRGVAVPSPHSKDGPGVLVEATPLINRRNLDLINVESI
jgi:hypothetical protein